MVETIDKSDYILEIKGLKYNKSKLLQVVDDFGVTSFISKNQTTLHFVSKNDYDIYNYDGQTGHNLFKQLEYVDYETQSQAYELIQSIIEQFNPILQPAMRGQFIKFPKGFELPKHTDDHGKPDSQMREAMIHISLTDETSPIEFYDSDQFLFEHEYTGPTIVNTQKMHTIKVPTQDRISFQLTFDTEFLNRQLWENLLLLHSKGKILN